MENIAYLSGSGFKVWVFDGTNNIPEWLSDEVTFNPSNGLYNGAYITFRDSSYYRNSIVFIKGRSEIHTLDISLFSKIFMENQRDSIKYSYENQIKVFSIRMNGLNCGYIVCDFNQGIFFRFTTDYGYPVINNMAQRESELKAEIEEQLLDDEIPEEYINELRQKLISDINFTIQIASS